MLFAKHILALAVLLTLAACDTSTNLNGAGTERGSYGQVKVGVPF